MIEYGKRGSSIKDNSSKQELINIEQKKSECSTGKLSEHEKLKQIIVRDTEEAKMCFRSKFNEIRIKQEQLKEQQAKQRVHIESMIKAVIEEAKKGVAEISRNINGHGSSMDLAEKYIKEAQKEMVEEREKLEERENQIVKEIKEKIHSKSRRTIDASKKVNATKMIQQTKLQRPKNSKIPEKHVTFTPLAAPSLKTAKHCQEKYKPRIIDNRGIDVEYNMRKKLKKHESNSKKEMP